ncbi:hypothetical protein LB503_002359 [Fusarium chuoi]|nr:hypothetical protein LB503_002359 [Fusarium chuoi]
MTIGQSEDASAAPHHFLLEKARLLAPIEWEVKEIAILIRDGALAQGGSGPRPMRLWGTLDLELGIFRRITPPQSFNDHLDKFHAITRSSLQGSGKRLSRQTHLRIPTRSSLNNWLLLLIMYWQSLSGLLNHIGIQLWWKIFSQLMLLPILLFSKKSQTIFFLTSSPTRIYVVAILSSLMGLQISPALGHYLASSILSS